MDIVITVSYSKFYQINDGVAIWSTKLEFKYVKDYKFIANAKI